MAAEAEPSGVVMSAPAPVSQGKSMGNGKHCHQCRQTRIIVASCKNQRNNRQCFIRICNKCLLNRYGENVEQVATLEQWSCPKCRGICNCSVCMKKRGHQPTGILITDARANGYYSVSDMLHKRANRTNNEKDGADMTADLGEGVDFSLRKKGKENSFARNLDANFQNVDETNNSKVDNESEKKTSIHGDGKKRKKPRKDGLDENADDFIQQIAESVLPVGTELTSVADIVMPAEDIGNALQFLKFCSVFEEIIDMKKGEAEYILEDVLRDTSVRREKSSLTVQFHMRLLSIIQDHGEKCVTRLWFNSVKKCLSESKHISKEPVVLSLEKAADYEALSATEKLKILNLLCDEVLGTEKVRMWISHQDSQFREKTKEAKQELRNAKIKGTIVSCSESEPVQAHEQSLELKSRGECDAMRIKPIFIEHRGRVYWKLNCNGKDDILYQNVGRGDTLTLDEKWYKFQGEEKAEAEKFFNSLRRK